MINRQKPQKRGKSIDIVITGELNLNPWGGKILRDKKSVKGT